MLAVTRQPLSNWTATKSNCQFWMRSRLARPTITVSALTLVWCDLQT